jgi:hypothetical protein
VILTPEDEDVAFALESVPGVLSVNKVVGGSPSIRYVVELASDGSTYPLAQATAQLIRLRGTGEGVEMLVHGVPTRMAGRLVPLVLDPMARERARARSRVVESRHRELERCVDPPTKRRVFHMGPLRVRMNEANPRETLVLGLPGLADAAGAWFERTTPLGDPSDARARIRQWSYARIVAEIATFEPLLRETSAKRLLLQAEVFLVTDQASIPLAKQLAAQLDAKSVRILVPPFERVLPVPPGARAPYASYLDFEHLLTPRTVLVLDPTGRTAERDRDDLTVRVVPDLPSALRRIARNDFTLVVVDATSRTRGDLDFRAIWQHHPQLKARTVLLVTPEQLDALPVSTRAPDKPRPLAVRPLTEAALTELLDHFGHHVSGTCKLHPYCAPDLRRSRVTRAPRRSSVTPRSKP